MKTLYVLVLTLFSFSSAFAGIINVNNATPSPGEYSSFSDAYDAAAPGDTLYFAPTNITYGNLTISKQVHLIGPGFGVAGGILGNFAYLGEITFNDVASSGSSLEGLRVEYPQWAGTGLVFTDFQIKRCIIDVYLYTGSADLDNSLIEGCYFPGAVYNFFPSDFNNCTIRNNVFDGGVYTVDNSLISNNLFLGASGGGATWIITSVTNSTVQNNIVIGKNVTGNASVTNVYSGNCSFDGVSAAFPGTSINLEGVDPQFVDAPSGLFTWLNDYQLAPTSPCIGSGSDGEDIGIYGGEGVYRKDGEPSIPIIRSVNVPGGNTVPANSTFTINIVSEVHE